MELNNGYQNIYLNGLDISLGGTLNGLKEQIRNILPNKIVVVSGVRVGDAKKLPIGVEVRKYITYTEEPEDWDEEEQGEFVPEEVFNLEIKNLYGYDLTIVDNVVSSAKTSVVSVADIEAGTIDNAKPIYCHPITMFGSSGEYHLTLLIFNNRSNPYFSVAELLADVRNWGLTTARLMCSGACMISSEPCIASYVTVTEDAANIICNKCSDGYSTQIALETLTMTGNFNDGVNKIN